MTPAQAALDDPAVVAPRRDRERARIAVLGASGYAGQEFARLSLAHDGLQLALLCSREHAGQPAGVILPGLDPRVGELPPVADPSDLPALARDGAFDTLVTCLPHGAWLALTEQQPSLAELPMRIVDFSSDFRDGAAGIGGAEGYTYGLPEAFRDSIASATRVANPGCYPTAATLALLPALESGWLDDPVMVSALSGVSIARRRLRPSRMFKQSRLARHSSTFARLRRAVVLTGAINLTFIRTTFSRSRLWAAAQRAPRVAAAPCEDVSGDCARTFVSRGCGLRLALHSRPCGH